MARKEAFKSLSEVRDERLRLATQAQHHSRELERAWSVLREPESRSRIIASAIGEAVGGMRPVHAIDDMLHQRNGTAAAAMSLLGIRSGKARLAASLMAAVAPVLWDRFMTPERLERLEDRVKTARDWLRELLTEREKD